MAGASIEIDVRGLKQIQQRIKQLTQRSNFNELLDSIGAELELQTRRRIEEEQQSPEGEAWAEWSDAYFETRHENNKKLFAQGELQDSLQYVVEGNEIHVGTNLIYGAIHQFGGEGVGKPNLPARPYLGLSDENIEDLVQVIDDWADAQQQRLGN